MIIAFIIAIIWGIIPIIHKLLLNDISYHTIIIFSAITFFIASLIYSYIYYKDIYNDINKQNNKIIYIILCAFLGLFLANILYYNALKHTHNVSIVTTITALYPLITLLLSYFILYEKISIINFIGIILIMIGIILLMIK
jgi:transporter family protein